MSTWLQWFLVVICATAVLLAFCPLIARAEERARRRAQKLYESWRCPKCGVALGPQAQHSGWVCRTLYGRRGFCGLFTQYEVTTSGPVLRCPVCQQTFQMEADGQARRDNRTNDERGSETHLA
jgi:cytochrome c-type biogenesis protein CcmH/NrfF